MYYPFANDDFVIFLWDNDEFLQKQSQQPLNCKLYFCKLHRAFCVIEFNVIYPLVKKDYFYLLNGFGSLFATVYMKINIKYYIYCSGTPINYQRMHTKHLASSC